MMIHIIKGLLSVSMNICLKFVPLKLLQLLILGDKCMDAQGGLKENALKLLNKSSLSLACFYKICHWLLL